MKQSRVLFCLILLTTIAACGGGGGGTPMVSPTPPPSAVTVISTVVTWAADNRTQTTTTSYSDGTKTTKTIDVPPVTSGVVLSTVNGVNSTSPLLTKFGNGVSEVVYDGSIAKPFPQNTLAAASIFDPNANVHTTTQTIDLRWGAKATPYVLPQADNVQATTSSINATMYFRSVTGVNYPVSYPSPLNFSFPLDQSTSLLQGVWITSDVKAAWAQGWTGAGVKIGVLDDFTANDVSEFLQIPTPTGCNVNDGIATCSTSAGMIFRQTHGDQVSMIAGGGRSSLAGAYVETGGYSFPGDSGAYTLLAGLSIRLSSPEFGIAKDATVLRDDFLTYQSNTNGLFAVLKGWGTGTDATSKSYRDLKVVNLSLGGTSKNPVSNKAIYATQLAYASASVTPDAVFVKAAGNSSCTVSLSNCDPYNAVFYNAAPFKDKSILVGALTQPGGPLASYSNKAGSYSDRFVVADGRGVRNIDGTYDQGTSFAAPRVSGYVAIIRQKFPNLTAANTTNVIFDTASWNASWGLKDATSQSIYGQGEANLGRALAPIGQLR